MIPAPLTPERRAFDSQGLLAIDPKAFGLMFDMFRAPEAPFELRGKAAIVRIDGPLQTAGWFCDTYDGVRSRVEAALASEASVVVLKVASPGGDVFGAFDTARAIRAAAKAAGKRLVGHTSANACSSAYALISAADEISASDSAVLGSIGVIATALDLSKQNEALGARFAIITSGARKSDGNPNVPLSDDARDAMQRHVDAMADVFFGLVKDHRGIDAKPLEAAQLVGAQALAAKLCDRLESFDALLARVESGALGAMLSSEQSVAPMPNDDDKKDDKKDEARAALAKAADGGNARAKRALAAYDEDKDEKAEDPKKDEKAEADEKDEKAEEPKKDEKASAAPFEKKDDKAEGRMAALEAVARRALFAARPDLDEKFVKACATLPIEAVESLIAATPRVKASANSLLAEPERNPTVGRDASESDRLPKAQADELSLQMGITEMKTENTYDPQRNVQSFGVKKAMNT